MSARWQRLQPLVWEYKHQYAEPDTYGDLSAEIAPFKLVFHPDDGIAPFWMLANDYNVESIADSLMGCTERNQLIKQTR